MEVVDVNVDVDVDAGVDVDMEIGWEVEGDQDGKVVDVKVVVDGKDDHFP